MCTTTRRGTAADHIRQVQVPGAPPPAEHRVTVTVVDPHGLLSDMIEPATMRAEMMRFLTEMKDAAGLPAPVRASLAALQFEVRDVPRQATADEVCGFGRADVPLYLLTVEFDSTYDYKKQRRRA